MINVFLTGFMMEMASWDGGISRTVQFVVPKVSLEKAGISGWMHILVKLTCYQNTVNHTLESSAGSELLIFFFFKKTYSGTTGASQISTALDLAGGEPFFILGAAM